MPRERIEWVDIWIEGADVEPAALPRYLLIGDSITRGYYQTVADHLRASALGARCAGSKFISDPGWRQELEPMLRDYRYRVIHLNNGLHGWDFTEDAYRAALAPAIAWIRQLQPSATLVWAQSTPVRLPGQPDQFHDTKQARIEQRNADAAAIMAEQGVTVNDLFTTAMANPSWVAQDGIHYNPDGNAGLGSQVASVIGALLA